MRRRAIGAGALALSLATTACVSAGPAFDVTPPRPESGTTEGTVSTEARVSPSGGFFNKGLGYGTDVYAGPFDVLLNKGYAVAQWEGKSRYIFDYPYGWNAAWKSISRPSTPVERAGGWWQVIRQHALPITFEEFRQGNWIPNYGGHVIEGGIAFRRLREWNEAQGLPIPGILAGLTTYAASVINEAYETPPRREWLNTNGTAGAAMDLLFFDPLGILIFSFDSPSRFFANTVGADIWPTQASLVVNDEGQLLNNSHSLVMRPPLPFTRVRLFARFGMGAQVGVSIPRDHGFSINVGAGFESKIRFLDQSTSVESIEASPSIGTWVDRHGSLLASVTFDQATNRRVAVNVFPGVVQVGGMDLGGWFVLDSEGRSYFGVTGSKSLGLGLGWGF